MNRIAVLIAAIMMAVSLSSFVLAEGKGSEKVKQATGEVTAVDAEAGSIAVNSKKKGDVSCDVVAGTKVSASRDGKALTGVKVGYRVTIRYVEKEGKNTCRSIEIKTGEK